MPVGRDTVLIMTGRTQEGFMHSENIIYKNEMNEKTTKFLDKFVKRVKGNPPGVCPIAVQLSFLQSARSQTCGKCVPCRDGWYPWRK